VTVFAVPASGSFCGRPVDDRLTNDPASGQHGDLEIAREWLTGGVSDAIENPTVTNDGPIAAVAAEILDWPSW